MRRGVKRKKWRKLSVEKNQAPVEPEFVRTDDVRNKVRSSHLVQNFSVTKKGCIFEIFFGIDLKISMMFWLCFLMPTYILVEKSYLRY